MSLEDDNAEDRVDSEFAGQNRMWVCEVRDESLRGGAYVVVSPLGSVDDEALPVRADRKGIIAGHGLGEPDAAESTAISEPGNREEP